MSARVAPAAWIGGARTYLALIFAGNLIWETAQLPLYTIWTTGTRWEQTFAVAHCTTGDLLIAVSTLALTLVAVGNRNWPRERFWQVAALAIVLGVGYTTFSEWLNINVRTAWAYSERMPVLPLFGFDVGLSPLLQWIIVPAASFAVTRAMAKARNGTMP
ncbi:MAG: hypothetical protein HY659_07810 [Rhizobiales bacterium]|nr:hypothetical protein [Hyphomicrobiales bacterium]